MKDDPTFDPDLETIRDTDGKVREMDFNAPGQRCTATALRSSQTLLLNMGGGEAMCLFMINGVWHFGTPKDLEQLVEALSELAQAGRKVETQDIVGDATIQ